MKKFAFVILALVLLTLTSCVSRAEYAKLQADNQALVAQNQDLAVKLETSEAALQQAKSEYDQLRTKYDEIANLQDFGSLPELKAWLAADTTDSLVWAAGTFDCDDFARMLMYDAFLDGYIVGFFATADHAMNVCFVGDQVYGIDPQTDEVMFWGYTWE